MIPKRPDPDALLRQIQTGGRLKIFLGYAANAGKSDRMFDEAKRRKSRGQDVVVALYADRPGHTRERGREAGLELVPIEQIPARQPEVCLIDPLAHRNPVGSAYAHRWEDALSLTGKGINVVGALNLQHIAEHQDAVERITGRRAADSVPLSFIQTAEDIVLVDIPPERSNLPADQISRLRELALLVTADVVEGQLQRYLDDHDIHQNWGTQERILVCITPGGNARPMLESAARAVERFHGHMLAVTVRQSDLPRPAEETLEGYLDYARRLGAEVHVIEGDDPVGAIISFSREQRITQLFAGHTRKPRWKFWAASAVDRLIEHAEGMDVRLFPHLGNL
jgi:two-component system sensor histidine kinase KdpD